MKHIVSLSSGLSSAITGVRVLERYGKDNTVFVFMDTLIEDDDNYRFMREYMTYIDMPLTTLREGRTPYEVATDVQIIPNSMIAPCTFKLKIELFKKYLSEIEDDTTVHIGYDYSETHRCEKTTAGYAEIGVAVDYPLLWKPIEYRKYERVSIQDWGIQPPRMYAMGYSHANCGGLCVKQGLGDWRRTLINFPERYAEIEEWEQGMRTGARENYSILKDRTGGEAKQLTLKEFRKRNTTKDEGKFDACVHCGIGDINMLE